MPFRDNTILGHFSCWLVRQSLKKNSAIDQNQLSVSTLKKNVKKIKQTMCYGRNWTIVISILQSKILVNGIKKKNNKTLSNWLVYNNEYLGKTGCNFSDRVLSRILRYGTRQTCQPEIWSGSNYRRGDPWPAFVDFSQLISRRNQSFFRLIVGNVYVTMCQSSK